MTVATVVAAATLMAAIIATAATTGAMLARAATGDHGMTTGGAWSEDTCRRDLRTVRLGQVARMAAVPRSLDALGPRIPRVAVSLKAA